MNDSCKGRPLSEFVPEEIGLGEKSKELDSDCISADGGIPDSVYRIIRGDQVGSGRDNFSDRYYK